MGTEGILLVLRIVQSIVRHLYFIVLLELVLVQVVATRPGEDKEPKEPQEEQETGLGGLIQLYISRVLCQLVSLLGCVMRIHRLVENA